MGTLHKEKASQKSKEKEGVICGEPSGFRRKKTDPNQLAFLRKKEPSSILDQEEVIKL